MWPSRGAGTLPFTKAWPASRKIQAQALQAHFDLAPTEFDEAWSKWVKKVYRKR